MAKKAPFKGTESAAEERAELDAMRSKKAVNSKGNKVPTFKGKVTPAKDKVQHMTPQKKGPVGKALNIPDASEMGSLGMKKGGSVKKMNCGGKAYANGGGVRGYGRGNTGVAVAPIIPSDDGEYTAPRGIGASDDGEYTTPRTDFTLSTPQSQSAIVRKATPQAKATPPVRKTTPRISSARAAQQARQQAFHDALGKLIAERNAQQNPEEAGEDVNTQGKLGAGMKKGGSVKKYASGGAVRGDGSAQRGRTKGRFI